MATSTPHQAESNLSPPLKAFAKRFGAEHLNLACHAAFPLALTPELIYCIRENFQPDCPWFAGADILLVLCDPVGDALYEFEPQIRNELLRRLEAQYGERRLDELSEFMVKYIRSSLQTNDFAAQDFGVNPQWTALAYKRPKQATHDIAIALKAALEKKNPNEWIKFSSVIESYALLDPLWEAGFEPLLTLSRGIEAQARGNREMAQEYFSQLSPQFNVQGVSFEVVFDFETVTVNRRGQITKRETKQASYFVEDLGNGIELEMVDIPGGKFMMGSPENENDRTERESPQHEVSVRSFFMGKYPITQAQWKTVVNQVPKIQRDLNPDPSRFKGDNRPVEKVSWYDAVEFCARLSKYTGQIYRLPSEAEWEYACRAGTTTPFHFGETITGELANYRASAVYAEETPGRSQNQTTPVGSFKVANAFGLYDMHGNVWEWCADPPVKGRRLRVLRGGSWGVIPRSCRSAFRSYILPGVVYGNFGFRVVCVLPRT